MAAEIADGWLPLYYSPYRQDVYADQIAGAKPGFEIMQGVSVNICDDVEQGLLPIKHNLALYMGGMGAKSRNFHNELMGRMGFEAAAAEIQDLFLAGKKEQAVLAVPTEFADEVSLVGSIDRIKDRLQAWRETPVTSLLVSSRSKEELRTFAELILN